MSTIDQELPPKPSEREPFKVGRVLLLTTKRLVRLGVLTTIALLLLLLPALFVKPPLLPKRQLPTRVVSLESDTTQTHLPPPAQSLSRSVSSTMPHGSTENGNAHAYFSSQRPYVQEPPEAEVPSDLSEQPVPPARAQFSFSRYTQAERAQSNNFQIGGITVTGPILSGRALARDAQGSLVRSLSQPNLLRAGRGFIPSSSLRSTSSGSSGGAVGEVRARNVNQSDTVVNDPDKEPDQTPVKESFGIFNFTTDRFGASTITRTRDGSSEIVASKRLLGEGSEQISLTGRSAVPTWNEFVGELFLIIVSPNLVGERTIEGFQLQKIDEKNHLQLLGVRNGDSIRLVNGEPITTITIEALPDLLLERQVEITVRHKKDRDITTLISVDLNNNF